MKKGTSEPLEGENEEQKIEARKELHKNCFRSWPDFYWLETDSITDIH